MTDKCFSEFYVCRLEKLKSDLLYELSNGRIKPSKFLVDCLSSSLNGNKDVELIDQQRIAFSNIKKETT